MQLDRTMIAVRERNVLDILDLSLQVLRHYARPIFTTFLLGAVPLAVINYFLIGWIPDFDYPEESLYRYTWHMFVLVYVETPLAGMFVTTYLGKAVFMEEPRIRECIRESFRATLPLIWTQLLLRGVLLVWLLLLSLDRYGEFEGGTELGLILALLLVVMGIRAFRPYVSEIVLLEKNPLFSRGKKVMTLGGRSSRFHSPNSGEVFARWIACSLVGMLLVVSFIWTMLWFPGVFTNNWKFGPYMIYFGLPAALWLVVCFFTVVRFLNYLDLRIRQEGWEVELRVRAEAGRLRHSMGEEIARPSLADRSTARVGALLLALVVGAASIVAPPLLAQEPTPVKTAGEALAARSDLPWYDSETESLRRLTVTPEEANPNPSNPNWKRTPRAATNWNFSWAGLFMRMLFYLFIALIVGLFLVVIWLLVRAFLTNEGGIGSMATQSTMEEDMRGDADRIEQLPFKLNRSNRGDLLAEAKRLYEAGNFRQAIVYLFSFQLLLLDRHHMIRLAKGKTNRQYLRETRAFRRVSEIFEHVMVPFEDVFFGDHAIDRDRFEACWNTLPEFQQLVQEEGPAQ